MNPPSEVDSLLEHLVFEIAQGVSGQTGVPFFRSLVRHLAAALRADFVLVGTLEPAIERVGNDEIAPQCDAAIIDAATRNCTSPVTVRLGIHLPDQHAAAAMRIDLVD